MGEVSSAMGRKRYSGGLSRALGRCLKGTGWGKVGVEEAETGSGPPLSNWNGKVRRDKGAPQGHTDCFAFCGNVGFPVG